MIVNRIQKDVTNVINIIAKEDLSVSLPKKLKRQSKINIPLITGLKHS